MPSLCNSPLFFVLEVYSTRRPSYLENRKDEQQENKQPLEREAHAQKAPQGRGCRRRVDRADGHSGLQTNQSHCRDRTLDDGLGRAVKACAASRGGSVRGASRRVGLPLASGPQPASRRGNYPGAQHSPGPHLRRPEGGCRPGWSDDRRRSRTASVVPSHAQQRRAGHELQSTILPRRASAHLVAGRLGFGEC